MCNCNSELILQLILCEKRWPILKCQELEIGLELGWFEFFFSTSAKILKHKKDAFHSIGVIFYGITKAFDTVNHELLLSKLSNLGLSASAVSWF